MQELNLSYNTKLTEKHSLIFNKLAKSKYKSFNRNIGKLYYKIKNENFLAWVISPTATRNPYLSKVFYYYLSFFFLKKITHHKNNIKKIIVDSSIQKKFFLKYIKSRNLKIEILIQKSKKNYIGFNFFLYIIRFFLIKFSKIF